MASEGKHTAGPWQAFYWDTAAAEIDDDNESPFVVWFSRQPLADELPANARLISAAPDLLALLQELIDIEGPRPGTGEWAAKVRAAIAKATAS